MARHRSTVVLAIGIVFLVHFAGIPSVNGSRRMKSPPEPSSSSVSGCGNGDGGSCAVSCEKPLKDCDFFFEGHEEEVPKIKLIKKGDNNIYVECGHIAHKIGYRTQEVQTVNSAHCSLLKGGSWDKHACHHRLYGNGRHIASREFNVGQPNDFLNACIKVQISAAQYKDGSNFNNGYNNPRACLLVRTKSSFHTCSGSDCKPPSPPPCEGSDCKPPSPPSCSGSDCKPPSPPPCEGSDCKPPTIPSCSGSDCKPPSPPPCIGTECESSSPPPCHGTDCASPSSPPCEGSDCKPPSPPSPPSSTSAPPACKGSDCSKPSPPSCDGDDCKPPSPPSSPPCDGDDCKPPSPPSSPPCEGDDCKPPSPPCEGDDCKPPSPPPACGDGDGSGCTGSCDKPLKECDFFFEGHENKVPTVKLIKKGDNNIYVECGHIQHRDGYDTRPVRTVNSAHCSLLMGGSWDKHACHHRLYGSGRHIASREFNVGKPNDFLNTCIKVQISAAQYKDGGNFNNGHNNPRACILVKTKGSFK